MLVRKERKAELKARMDMSAWRYGPVELLTENEVVRQSDTRMTESRTVTQRRRSAHEIFNKKSISTIRTYS